VPAAKWHTQRFVRCWMMVYLLAQYAEGRMLFRPRSGPWVAMAVVAPATQLHHVDAVGTATSGE
jgi:hypothetical protein